MKIVTIIGARPQFIKAAVVSKKIIECDTLKEVIVHTGQHFDANMSEIFFDQMNIPKPDYQLDVHGGSHGEMTGRMLMEIERVLVKEKPDMVMVYGDTNSTLAGALAAAKLHIPVAHIEAGLRSFNMQMPEEINRILTDNMSDILFCPTQTAIDNLDREGFQQKPVQIVNVGDVMQDAALLFAKNAGRSSNLKALPEEGFILATCHRAENTDNVERLLHITDALNHIHRHIMPVVIPLHPRTKAMITKQDIPLNVITTDPVGYLEMIWLLQRTNLVLTDSGGLQKEAFFFRKPCVTMRDQTEWVELVKCGANVLAGADKEQIVNKTKEMLAVKIHDPDELYGGGRAGQNIVNILLSSSK